KRDRVLDEGGGAISSECRGQSGPEGVPSERADHTADNPGEHSADHSAGGSADRGAGNSSRDNAGTELKGRGAAGRGRQLIKDVLPCREQSQNPRRPSVADEGEPRTVQMEPS